MNDLHDLAVENAKKIRENFPGNDLAVQQVLYLAQEAGETQEAFLLWQDGGDIKDFAFELADVLITAYVTAEVLGIALDATPDPLDRQWSGRPATETLWLGREVGGFVGAYQRWAGMARRSGRWDVVVESLGKVVQAAYAAADALRIDLDAAWREKAGVIATRGWRDKPAEVSQ